MKDNTLSVKYGRKCLTAKFDFDKPVFHFFPDLKKLIIHEQAMSTSISSSENDSSLSILSSSSSQQSDSSYSASTRLSEPEGENQTCSLH